MNFRELKENEVLKNLAKKHAVETDQILINFVTHCNVAAVPRGDKFKLLSDAMQVIRKTEPKLQTNIEQLQNFAVL